jgi:photosystem II stability/assembly factor-like uncharacterized protein
MHEAPNRFHRDSIRLLGGLAATLGSLVIALSAYAHDPPEISRIFWGEGDRVVLRANRGLLFGERGSSNWRFMCGEAWGTPFGEQPDLLDSGPGRWLAATTRGLTVTTDEGCTWQGVEPFASTPTSALTRHPDEPDHLYLGIWDAEQGGLFESRDAGATWAKRLHIGRADHIAQIMIAPSDPDQLYLNGLVYDERAGQFSFQLTRSRDAGLTWTRTFIPLQPTEDEATLLAISPHDPDTVLVLAISADREQEPDRVLVSRDGGFTFRTLLQGSHLLNAGFSVDGTTAFVTGNEGFYRADAELTEVTPVGDAQFVSCVSPHEGALYVCGHHSGFDPAQAGVGVSTDAGASFEPMMRFTEVAQTVACAPDSNTARVCEASWLDWQVEVLVGVGGAPLESVPGWRTFDMAEPEPMSGRPSLSTAEPPLGTGASSPASAAMTDALTAAEPAAAASGGCALTSIGRSRANLAGPLSALAALALVWRRRRSAATARRAAVRPRRR